MDRKAHVLRQMNHGWYHYSAWQPVTGPGWREQTMRKSVRWI